MKKYGTVKIKDPGTEGHSIRLLPLQAFDVVCTKFDPEDDYNVFIVGEFLTLSEIQVDEDKVTFKVEQKYDLTGWSKISTLFLGNIVLSKRFKGGDQLINLCVYCQPTNEMKSNVLTVINPDDLMVKVEPNQLLHIVTFDRNEKARWSLEKTDGFTCVRCETVVNDFTSVYDPDSLFCQEPRSGLLAMNPSLKERPKEHFGNEVMGNGGVVTEYHFWLCLTASEIKKIHNSPNGSYPMPTLEIKGEYQGRTSFRKMKMMLGLRGKKNINFDYFKTIHALGRGWNERSLSYVRHSIFNPNPNENIDVSGTDGWFYLEIPHPSMYFDGFDQTTFWFCENDMDHNSTLMCHELNGRYVNGIEVQRFLISNLNTKYDDRLLNLGVLNFKCVGNAERKSLSLSFWKIPESGYCDLPPVSGHVKTKLKTLGYKNEVELELVKGDIADEGKVTPLFMIDGKDIDYSEYLGEDYMNALTSGSKKKTPLLLPLRNGTRGTPLPAFVMGCEIPMTMSDLLSWHTDA